MGQQVNKFKFPANTYMTEYLSIRLDEFSESFLKELKLRKTSSFIIHFDEFSEIFFRIRKCKQMEQV